MNCHPAMKFCILFIFGIVIGWICNLTLWLLGTVLVSGIIFVVALMIRNKNFPSFLFSSILCMVVAAFGALKITYDAKYIADDRISNSILKGSSITVHGTLIDLPRKAGQSIQFVIESNEIKNQGNTRSVSGGILVSCKNIPVNQAYIESLTYGRKLSFYGELTPAGSARNPGEFDFRKYLEMNNIFARMYIDTIYARNIGEPARYNFLTAFVYPVRRAVAERLDRLIGGAESGFLKGLIIGERSEISPDVKSAFINSGVMHILAVSGLHVAIVAMILLVMFQMIRIPERPSIVLTCFLLLYYIFLTGAAASVARSVIMAIIFLSARLIERKVSVYNTLAISAIVLLLIDSKQLFQPGFQLSFVAVLSLVYLYPKILNLKELLPEGIRKNRFVYVSFAAFAVSLAAGVGTLPFTSIYFGKISLISFVANIIIVPLSNVILCLGMLAVAVSFGSYWIASVYADATAFLTWLLLRLVEFFGNLSFSYIDSHFTIWSAVIFYAIIIALVQIGKRETRKAVVIIGLIVANIVLYGWLFFSSEKLSLKVTMIDIGQGDAFFVQFPDGKNILIDAGPKTFNSDAGERFIAPFLRKQSIRRLNTIALSHPHSDHIGGVPYLLRHFDVDQVIDAGSFGNSGLYREYLHLVDSLKIVRRSLQAGETIREFDNARLYLLHPSGQFIPGDSSEHVNFNNQSLVMKLVYDQTSLLFLGDAENEAEAIMVNRYGDFLQSNVLKAGHHGSITSSTVSLLHAVQPQIALISVGRKNKFHHPSPEVLGRFNDMQCVIYRTDESGAVVLESDGKQWTYSDWH